jgi:inorganic pyrophosphatase
MVPTDHEKEAGANDIALAFLGVKVAVAIDRPMGSTHPEWGFVYPINYGYVPGVIGGDGEDLDAYVLGVDRPLERFEGRCIAVIRRIDDDDDKLVVVPLDQTFCDARIRELTAFQEQFFNSVILRKPG